MATSFLLTGRSGTRASLLVSVLALLLGLPAVGRAVDRTWYAGSGNSGFSWNTTANWTGDILPGIGDLAIFTDGLGVGSLTLDASRSVLGLQLTNTMGNDYTFTTGTGTNTLTIGSSGIDMNTSGSGNLTISAGVIAAGSQSWDVNTGRTLTVDTTGLTISSGTLLTLGGAGNYIFNAGITYTGDLKITNGTTTIAAAGSGSGAISQSAGILRIEANNALGTGAFTITGGTLNNTTSSLATITNALNLNENITFAGTGTGGLAQTTGAITLNDNRQITVTANTLTLGGAISTTGSSFTLTKAGSGTLVLNGNIANTISTITINGGTLTLGGNNAQTGNTIINAASTILNINHASALGTGTLAVSSGTATVNNTSGVAVVTSTPVTLSGGSLIFSGSAAANNLTLGDVTMNNNRTITVTNAGGTLTVGAIGQSSGSRALTKAGAGTLIINGSGSYTGTTTVRAGNLLAGTSSLVNTDGAFGNTNTAIVLGDASTGSNTIGLLTNAAAVNIGRDITVANQGTGTSLGGNSANTSTFSGAVTLNKAVTLSQVANGQVNFTGNITGAQNVTIGGTGTLVYGTTPKDYNGTTTINSGATLLVNSSTSSSANTFSVSGTLGGTGTIAGATTINSGGTLAPGASIGTMFSTTSVSFSSSGIFGIELGAKVIGMSPGLADKLVLSGASSVLSFAGGSKLKLFSDGFDLAEGETEQFIIASVATGTGGTNILVGGSPVPAEMPTPISTYVFGTGSSGPVTIDVSMFPVLSPGSTIDFGRLGDNLVVSVTYAAVPEPHHVLLICVGALLVGLAIRRRLLRAEAV